MKSATTLDAPAPTLVSFVPTAVIHKIEIQPVPNQRLFSVGAAANYLGMSDDSLRKYADLGQIPVYRNPFNGNRTFKLEDLNTLIDHLILWNDRAIDTACAGRV